MLIFNFNAAYKTKRSSQPLQNLRRKMNCCRLMTILCSSRNRLWETTHQGRGTQSSFDVGLDTATLTTSPTCFRMGCDHHKNKKRRWMTRLTESELQWACQTGQIRCIGRVWKSYQNGLRKKLTGGSFSKGSQNRHSRLSQLFNTYQNFVCVQQHQLDMESKIYGYLPLMERYSEVILGVLMKTFMPRGSIWW